jgi:hypothetical protein
MSPEPRIPTPLRWGVSNELIIKKPNISSPLLILAVFNWEAQANLSNQEA